jgi:hypothetical protein
MKRNVEKAGSKPAFFVKIARRPLFFRLFQSFWVAKGRRKTIVGTDQLSRSKTVERVET